MCSHYRGEAKSKGPSLLSNSHCGLWGTCFFCVHKKISGVACRRISQRKQFVTPLCGLILNVMFHADAGFGCNHPLVNGQITIWLETGLAGVVEGLDLEKLVILSGVLFLSFSSSPFGSLRGSDHKIASKRSCVMLSLGNWKVYGHFFLQ